MRKDKHFLLDEVREKLEGFPSFVVMSYEHFEVNDMNAFRRKVHGMGGDVHVVKKRVLVKAAEQFGIPFTVKDLPGHVALVFNGVDPLETTKYVFTFSKDNDNILKVLGGRFDGKMISGNDVEMLSKLPGKDQMRAEFLATLEAPLSGTLSVLEALLTSVPFCLENKSQQQE